MALIEKYLNLHGIEGEASEPNLEPPSVSQNSQDPEIDLIERLRSNVDRLQILCRKLKFINSEVQSAMGMDPEDV